MDACIQRACLAEIWSLWSTSAETLRPGTAWIAEHQPVPHGTDDPETAVVHAWYLGEHGIAQRAAEDYVRFLSVHSGRHWASGTSVPPAAGVFNNRPGRTHTIGLASFAPIQRTDLVYLQFIWGGTHGAGATYRFDPHGQVLACVQNIWRS